MDNLEKALVALFRYVPVQKIITGEFSPAKIEPDDFVRLMRGVGSEYDETELRNLYYYLSESFMEEFYGAESENTGEENLNVFELLRKYTEWVLTIQDNEIVCEYARLLHWRMVTKKLSEDLFTTSFMAARKREIAYEKVPLDWKVVITHNNWELHKILEQGMVENHAHLKGTAPVFHLTWIRLMNDPELYDDYGRREKIEQHRRNISRYIFPDCPEEKMSVQLIQAAYIRYLLFHLVCHAIWKEKLSETLEVYWEEISNPYAIYKIKRELLVEIAAGKMCFGELLDYALAGVIKENGDTDDRTKILQGERWILYHCFSIIFSKGHLYGYLHLFYAYLVIKENFRAEFVQNNDDAGFENFRIYEDRKDIFLENIFIKKELVKKAVEAGFEESRAVVLETRIGPKKSAEDYCEYIQSIDELFLGKQTYRRRFFYVVHFIKEPDQDSGYEFVKYRHYKNRQKYKKEALKLAEFREKYPEKAKRIKGIDAANTEIGCGPEVFAQAFRYLSDHVVLSGTEQGLQLPQLRKTYHVGEDFLDLVSGLRAIDETVRFLDMKCGDRLGHALALGIDADDWYCRKNNRILLTKQEYLDNVAWMYHLGVVCHIDDQENILNFLRREYEYYFRIIYKNAMDQMKLHDIGRKAKRHYEGTEWEKYYTNENYDFSIENYYSSWELRGDNPELYQEGFYDNQSVLGYRYQSFAYYSINRKFPQKQNKRYFQEIALLYYYYHYDGNVRKEGNKTIEKKVDKAYIHCAQILQHELQKMIAKKGIGIETNPSSNTLIGIFKRYDQHPILNFYNKGLTEKKEKLRECPQLSVSINTDDAGIFSTSLENEYAYMALALEKAKDEQGNFLYKKRDIYDWLNCVRMMGLRQAFLSEEEMKTAIKEWKDDRA